MDVYVYTLEDTNEEEGLYWTFTFVEADEEARRTQQAVISNTYVWDDAELVVDYRPKEN